MKITKLKKRRLEKGFKQIEIAQEAQKSIRTYQDYEAGEFVPDIHTAIRIAKKLEITSMKDLEDLFEIPQRQLRGTSPSEITHQNDSTKM